MDFKSGCRAHYIEWLQGTLYRSLKREMYVVGDVYTCAVNCEHVSKKKSVTPLPSDTRNATTHAGVIHIAIAIVQGWLTLMTW